MNSEILIDALRYPLPTSIDTPSMTSSTINGDSKIVCPFFLAAYLWQAQLYFIQKTVSRVGVHCAIYYDNGSRFHKSPSSEYCNEPG